MMRAVLMAVGLLLIVVPQITAQDDYDQYTGAQSSFYDVAPRWLVDAPTAGTLPRAYFDISFRFYPNGGTIGYTNIGLSNRLTMGISFGGDGVLSNVEPEWNPKLEFSIKLRILDELEYFPAIAAGFSSQGTGAYDPRYDRFTFKSRGFYAVASRSFYFMSWTSGWHAGVNYSLEYDRDDEQDINLFAGFDATFKYNLGLALEYDAALNDNSSRQLEGVDYKFSGKGRGYLNCSIKWLFARNLEIELLMKDLLLNRREADTFTRELRLTYVDMF
jgi:hypothetical protein